MSIRALRVLSLLAALIIAFTFMAVPADLDGTHHVCTDDGCFVCALASLSEILSLCLITAYISFLSVSAAIWRARRISAAGKSNTASIPVFLKVKILC